MRQIWSIAAKELRGYFNSAVALIFLATFLAVVLFAFFWVDKFLARGVADVRPLFEWLPLLLIFLVAALTMRLWSEEQKTGTIEILLTLPVPIHRLVVGKFLAGLLLVAIALGLTLGLPITVSMMGDLDWGPVFGGYLAALLLAAMYLSLGLCVSATTDNQIVSLIGTVFLCTLLYLPGADAVAGLFGVRTGEVLRMIGTGSRFESIARGVLDLRDLAYYAGWVVLLLAVNTVILKARRWSAGEHTAGVRRQNALAVALIGANALALNLWLAPVTAARVDLTADGLYSLSPPTKRLLRALDEPLRIHGYFSGEDMPDVLKPLVPQIRDLLAEYEIEGGTDVKLAFLDPSADEDLAKEIDEQYNIKSQPFRFADRSGAGIRNAFFYILVAYGDQFEVLGIDELIDVDVSPDGEPDIRLRNLEYQVTRAIRKVVYGFQSLEALFSSLPEQVQLELYITPDTLPAELKSIPEAIRKVAEEVVKESGGKLAFREVVPATDEERQELYAKYNVQPLPLSVLLNRYVYLDLVMRMGEKTIRIGLGQGETAADDKALRSGIEEALELIVPGFIKVVGLVVPPAPPPQQMHPSLPPQRVPPPQSFERLRGVLEQSYEVRTLDLGAGAAIGDDVDVLVVAGPDNLNETAQRAIDQHLMRGRSVIVLAGKHRLDLQSPDLGVEQVTSGLDGVLEAWGVKVGDSLVMDTENIKFPAPQGGARSGPLVETERPYFVKVVERGRRGGMITSWLGDVVLHWVTPVTVAKAPSGGGRAGGEQPAGPDEDDGAAGDGSEDERATEMALLSSSGRAWLEPNAARAGLSAPPPLRPSSVADADKGPHTLGVALVGSFDSAFRDKDRQGPVKLAGGEAKEGDEAKPAGEMGRLLERSPPRTRLAVVGSSAFASDLLLDAGRQLGIPEVENNLKLVQSLVDWAVADEELLAIRAHGGRVRTLDLEDGESSKWEIINYALALLGLATVVALAWVQRRGMLASFAQLPGAGGRGVQVADSRADHDDEGEDKGKDKTKAKPKVEKAEARPKAEAKEAEAKEAEAEEAEGEAEASDDEADSAAGTDADDSGEEAKK